MIGRDSVRAESGQLSWALASPRPFDDRRFPCAPPYLEAYERACRRGESVLARSRIVVCGLARDVEHDLPDFVARIDRLSRRVAELRVVVYENDSVDRTPQRLREWQEADPRVVAICERPGDAARRTGRARARTEQLARYRNRYRDHAVEHFRDFDYVLVSDLDLLGWSERGLAHPFGHDDWDVVGANGLSIRGGRPVYYDAWAFRALGHETAHRNRSVNLMVFPTGSPRLRVASCFGGLAVYRMEALRAARYGGDDCEHVVLHRRMAAAGFDRIELDPSLLVRYPDQSRFSPDGRDTPRWWTLTDASESTRASDADR